MLVLVPVLLIPVQPLKKLIKRLTHLSEFVFFISRLEIMLYCNLHVFGSINVFKNSWITKNFLYI